MDIAIIGGSGNVGAATARALLADGHKVRVICRTKSSVPADLATCFYAGDLSEPTSLSGPIAGAEALMMITPSVENETQMGLAALHIAKEAAIPKLVYMATMNPELMQAVPHFKNKLPIKQAAIEGWKRHVSYSPIISFRTILWCSKQWCMGASSHCR